MPQRTYARRCIGGFPSTRPLHNRGSNGSSHLPVLTNGTSTLSSPRDTKSSCGYFVSTTAASSHRQYRRKESHRTGQGRRPRFLCFSFSFRFSAEAAPSFEPRPTRPRPGSKNQKQETRAKKKKTQTCGRKETTCIANGLRESFLFYFLCFLGSRLRRSTTAIAAAALVAAFLFFGAELRRRTDEPCLCTAERAWSLFRVGARVKGRSPLKQRTALERACGRALSKVSRPRGKKAEEQTTRELFFSARGLQRESRSRARSLPPT